jgi:serine protease
MRRYAMRFAAVALICGCAAGASAVAGMVGGSLAMRGYPIFSNDSNPVLPERPAHTAGDIIVRFRTDADSQARDALLDKHRCSILRTCDDTDLHRVAIPKDRTPEQMVELFQAEEAVEYAELNPYVSIYFVPNDPYYHYQWNLDNAVTGGIDMQAAWNVEMGDPNVIIAVLDTGVAYENYGRFKQAPDLAETSFVPGFNFINDSNHVNDDQGHGTHVTGTLAQSTENGLGVAGVAFRCSIMPVKVLDFNGVGDEFTVSEGIYFATAHGAKVINMSFGSPQGSTTMENAMAFAYQRGVTLVCAAGNDFQRGDMPSYPAAYDAYCIAVAATRFDGTRSYYSTTGPYVDIAAPGGDMMVDQNGDGYPDGIVQQTFTIDPNQFAYFFFQGTSMAAPHVSGVAALLVSKGVIQPDKVRQAIEMTAKDMGAPGWDPEYGWGIVDAFAALTYQPPR